MVRPDGSDPITFTSSPGLSISSPDWSPDGTRILFNSRSKVYTFDLDDGEVRLLVDMGSELNAPARWSPDGKHLLIAQFPDLYVMRVDGSSPVKIAQGGLGGWGSSPAATVTDARAEARWALGRQVGSLALAGSASHASELQVTIRSAKVAYPPTSASAPAGEYRLSVRLPAGLLPGSYTVTVGGTSAGERLLDVVRSVAIASPSTGIVSRSSISATPRGPSRARVPKGTTTLFARFGFAVRPASGQRLTAVWRAPSGVIRRREKVAVGRIVRATIVDETGLAPGRWRCTLEANGTTLAVAAIRVG